MDFYDYLDTLNLDLELLRYNCQSNRWTAKVPNAETKDYEGSGLLHSTYGNGTSPESAIRDYISQIVGRVLVIDAYGNRRVFKVPQQLVLKESGID